MTIQDEFLEAIDELQFQYDVEPRSYSGRCMYGERCFAIDGDALEVQSMVLAAIAQVGANRNHAPRTIARELQWNADSMGLGVVYYWPAIEWPHAEG